MTFFSRWESPAGSGCSTFIAIPKLFGVEIYKENFRDHDVPPETREGIEGLRRLLSMLATAFPDIHVDVQDMAVDNDTVAVRLVVSGTHKGYLMGTIPPSGNHATWTGMDFLKISDGKIVERWGIRDRLGLIQQIGAVKN